MDKPAAEPRLLILPGLSNSGPAHWQSVWQASSPAFERVQQRDWDKPDRSEWIAALDAHIARETRPVILIAHSLSCALVAHWAASRKGAPSPVVGALLVAPADVDSEAHTPPETRSFAPFPMERLPFASELIASRTDPYLDFHRAEILANAWGAPLTDAGDLGHINAASALGLWPLGQERLAALMARTGFSS